MRAAGGRGSGRYVALFGIRTARFVVPAGFAGRLPLGFYGLVFVLVVQQETGSFGIAGGVTAAFATGCAAAPMCARAIDHVGARILLPLAIGHAVAVIGMLLLLVNGAPAPALLLCAWAAGLLIPPVGPLMRAIWASLIPDAGLLTAALSLEAVTMEVVFLLGALCVAAAAAAGSLLALLVVGPALTLVGTIVILAHAGDHIGAPAGGPRRRGGGLLGALRSREMLVLTLSGIPIGAAMGCVEVAAAAFAETRHGPAFAGMLLASLSIGGISVGLVYGARAQQRRLRTRFTGLSIGLGALAGLLAASAWIPTTALLLVACGAVIAPLLTVSNQLAAVVALPGTKTEAFTWQASAYMSGMAIGTTVAGAAIDAAGPAAGFGAGALIATLSAAGGAYLVLGARRAGSQRPPAPEPGEAGASVPISGG